MTVEQKDRITALRNSGKSYAEIAKELGLGKSTVSNFCLRNGVEPGRNNLIETPFRGNVVHAGSLEKPSIPACNVTVTYAEKTNEAALADALKILMNVR